MLNCWNLTQEQFYQQHTWTDFIGFPEDMSWMIQNTCFISVVVVLPDVKCLRFVTHAVGVYFKVVHKTVSHQNGYHELMLYLNKPKIQFYF